MPMAGAWGGSGSGVRDALAYLARAAESGSHPSLSQEGLERSGFENDQESGLDVLNWRELSDIQVEMSIRSMV